MYNCEIYSVKKASIDVVNFEKSIDDIASMLYSNDIRVIYKTDISCDANKVTKALIFSQQSEDSPDYYIFANALDTTDNSSFKKLFYDYVKYCEQNLKSSGITGDQSRIRISTLGDFGNGYKGYCFQAQGKRFIVLPRASLADAPIIDIISQAISRSNEIFTDVDTQDDTVANPVVTDAPEKRKKEGFFSSFIPHKYDPKNVKRRKWIVLIAIIVFLCALGYLINELFIQPYLNDQINSEIQSIAYNDNSNKNDNKKKSAQDWDALKKINKEIVGWITLDGTKIDYPVLEHKGDSASGQFYLKHNYKKEYTEYGSVFIDYRSKQSVNSKNVIMHGHNMNDGSMFHTLVNYGDLTGNLDYYKKHPIITFNTPQGDNDWKIISVFKTSTLYEHGEFFNYMQGEFLSDAEFMNFVYNVRIRSLINAPVMCNEDDQIITLSTCSYEFSQWRTVVVARKLREGEKSSVNTEIATLNQNPVFPDIYYSSRGGTRPQVLTFKTANEKGLINWYDGKGALNGSEVLTATVAANPTQPPETKSPSSSSKSSSSQSASSAQQTITWYTVRFLNYDGSEHVVYNVKKGDSVSVPTTIPQLPSDDYYNYTFTGWQTDGLDLNNVHYSMDIAPDFKATPK